MKVKTETKVKVERERGRFSLKYKFILPLVAFTVIVALSFGMISIKRLSSELEAQVVQNGLDLADKLVEKFAFVAALESPTLQLLAYLENLRFLQENLSNDVLYFQVVLNGQNYSFGRVKSPPVEPVVEEGVRRRRLEDGTPYLEVRRLIPTPGGLRELTFGSGPSYIGVGLSLAGGREAVRQEIFTISLVSLGYIIVGVLVAFFFYQMILGPVERLIDSVKRFRLDRRARASVRSGDELELLAEEFNKMADAIEERDRNLERINQELLRANQVKSEFLAMMGHELKTPLHAIRGFSQLLLEGIDGPLTPKQREDVESILASGDHLLELIDNLLRFSKLEAGEERLHLEEVDPATIAAEVAQAFERFAREKGLELRLHVNPMRIQADGTKLRQILMNLVSNAVKYTKRGTVEIAAEARDGNVLFVVADTGPGIPPQDQERIFEPFTQLDSSSTRETMGLGLGLAIVKKYVELHGGRVWLESAPGEGSRFYFTIPQFDRGGMDEDPGR